MTLAHWIASRNSNSTATTFGIIYRHVIPRVHRFCKQFEEEYRPYQLSRFVYEFERRENQNDFSFAQTLDCRLFPLR